jgi:hypothetical protein
MATALKFENPILEASVLNQVDGSASWKQGQTKVISSVSGPIEVKARDEVPTAATLDLVVRPAVGLSSTLLIISVLFFLAAFVLTCLTRSD